MSSQELKEFESQVQEQLAQLATLVGGKSWGISQGYPRIYMPSRKDCRVYFEFLDYPTGDPADLLGGVKLQVFIDDCDQHPNWYKGQRAKIAESMHQSAFAIEAYQGGQIELAEKIIG